MLYGRQLQRPFEEKQSCPEQEKPTFRTDIVVFIKIITKPMGIKRCMGKGRHNFPLSTLPYVLENVEKVRYLARDPGLWIAWPHGVRYYLS